MFVFRSLVLVAAFLYGGVSLAAAAPADQAATPAPCVTPPGGVVVLVDAPSPGAVFAADQSITVSGIAYDVNSTQGPGIDALSVFLDDRDTGGKFLGNASVGQPNPAVPADSPITNAGFRLRSSSLPMVSGEHTLFVYARSALTQREGVARVPVFLGTLPSNATAVPSPTPFRACQPAPTPVPTATATVTPFVLPTLLPSATPATAALATVSVPTLAPLPLEPVVTATPRATAAPAAAAVAATQAPAATTTTAPRGGGIPSALGLPLLAVGLLIGGVGVALRRRERR